MARGRDEQGGVEHLGEAKPEGNKDSPGETRSRRSRRAEQRRAGERRWQ